MIIHRLIAARSVAGGLARLAIAGTIVASGVLVMAQAAQASWLQVSLPQLGAGTNSGLSDISCTSATVCMAVGTSQGSTSQVLAESRSGSIWAVQDVAQPAPGSSLNGISCTSASACITVGDTPKGSTGAKPLAERWDGIGWTILGAKDIATATRTTLTEVSCVSATRCMAVGDSENSVREVPLAELWNGIRWRILPAPAVKGGTLSLLSGISCTSSARCIAVGYSVKSGNFATLAELWNGQAWKIIATPTAAGAAFNAISCKAGMCEAVGAGIAARWNGTRWSKLQKLANPGGNTPASLGSVSCTVKHTCYGSGSYYLDAVQTSVVEYFNGTRWTVQNATITTANDSSGFGGVSCTTPTRCTLVGFYHDPDNGNQALAMDFTLRWQDVSPVPVVSVNGLLGSVSCWSPQWCIAVGTDSTAEPFAEFWGQGSWTAQAVPKPKVTSLNAVSCPVKFDCFAVGSIVRNGVEETLAERWTGTWTIQRTPNPAGSSRSVLRGLSCTSKSACTAVGLATRSGHQVTLAERWNGKSWQIEATPNLKGKVNVQLNSVSCTSTKACTTVGSYVIGKFAETWNGTSWKLHAMPTPAGGTQASVDAVSCTSAKACTAVGQYNRGSKTVPLAERWNGTSWQPQLAVARGGSSAFTSVSCTAASACTAVVSTGSKAVAESWNGKTWAVQGVQSPVLGSLAFGLNSVWCNSPIACMAVGTYLDTSATQFIFAEQYS